MAFLPGVDAERHGMPAATARSPEVVTRPWRLPGVDGAETGTVLQWGNTCSQVGCLTAPSLRDMSAPRILPAASLRALERLILPSHHIAFGDMSAVKPCDALRAGSPHGAPAGSIGLRQLIQDRRVLVITSRRFAT
ncbi:hypothetical protein [Paracidovorax anthurii]|uniref:hypothetical protein n=1 Tax=Paracidovorax anthurii TaxID=78229 RepID=UPI0011BE58CA|nr:hypothetical protein [Paracidovorax anthurii]